nr:myb family transcription factor EFM isoform X1 [Ipomoea batatas]
MQVEGLTNDEVKESFASNLFPVDQYGDESSKQSSSQSGSPQGTLQLAGSDSMEEDGDDRSE